MVSVDDPSVHQLRLLLALAEELHFGRAAARLYLTQPALSQQIRSLERRLGVKLFARTSRQVEVTPIGQALLPLVKNVVDATDHLRNAVHDSVRGEYVLNLGLSDCSAPLASTHRVLETLTALHPGLELRMRVVDLVEQVRDLQEGRLDAAFVYLPAPDGLRIQPLTTEPRVACLASTDPLAQQPSLELADLADRPTVSLTSEVPRATREFWAADPRPGNVPIRYTSHHVTRVESLLSAVSFDQAVAFLPAVAAELYPRPDIRYVPVRDLPYCTFGVVWLDSEQECRQVAALEQICRQLHAKGLPHGTIRYGAPDPDAAW